MVDRNQKNQHRKVQRKEIYELTSLTAESTVSAFWASSVQCSDARMKVKLTCRRERNRHLRGFIIALLDSFADSKGRNAY